MMKGSGYLVVALIFVCAGCGAWRQYKKDYLNADQYHAGEWKDAAKTYKEDYLNSKPAEKTTFERAYDAPKLEYVDPNKDADSSSDK